MVRLLQLCLLAPLFCACAVGADEQTSAPAGDRLEQVEGYYGAVEVTTDGAQAVFVGVGQDDGGRYIYEQIERLSDRAKDANYPFDRKVSQEETDLIFGHIDKLRQDLEEFNQPLSQVFLTLSPEYENLAAGPILRAAIAAAYPDLNIRELTPEREARANFYTMQGRTDMQFNEFVLVDIGASNTIMSVFDVPVDTTLLVRELPYGSRSMVDAVDPLSDLHVSRLNERRRLERLVLEAVELPIKKTLRSANFSDREKVVFMGGLVYKIIKTLEVPLTGRPIDFSRASEAELSARFKALLFSPNPDLSAGPSYTPEELYAALIILEIIMEELGDRQSAFFFERSTWLPGLILDELQRARTGLN